ncbi:Similar to CG32669: Putative sodium-dependent multivitamin transporter (Drosophila melanogaster) [Cotesia congregata]|uniref:Similar to CG32669: Putative sodium-dependent multivitamin transporter (Drosophila melanogaster) n=1 Tax=Cotesia congregata TaxID=51543 RepID=A0A8J2HQT1_COTCN|nr:Similar to CG32669: Putative sodium-dependent multivitamin transporter (Drosophila melanogaster) [Cotesia congregata]
MKFCFTRESSTMETAKVLEWGDYLVITLTIAISVGIGIYYRFAGDRQKTSEEYFSANRSMGPIAIGICLMVSFMSAITLLGMSAESYDYGTHFIIININYIISTPIICYAFLPVFYKLQATSTYEYLEKRFGIHARLLASFVVWLQMLLYSGVVLYAPALAFETTTGLTRMTSILSVGLTCAFYSSIGGIKAVLITDIFQAVLMFASLIGVIAVATYSAGGLGAIFEIANQGGRIDLLNFSIDPTERHTWWTQIIGGMCTFLSLYAVNQIQVQRFLTVRSLKKAQLAMWFCLPILITLNLATSLSGLAIYSKYFKCDPKTAKKIDKSDMLLPYYVMDAMSAIPGLSGLIVAGVFSAGLSTISAALNSLAAVTLEDYVKPLYSKCTKKQLSPSTSLLLGKFLAFITGFLCIALAVIAQHFKNILQSANQRGAVLGTALSLMFSLWMSFGSPRPAAQGLPLSIEGCSNETLSFLYKKLEMEHITLQEYLHPPIPDKSQFLYLYRISYMWTGPIGFFITIVIGLVTSKLSECFGLESPKNINPDLFFPFIAKRIRKRLQTDNGVTAYKYEFENKTRCNTATTHIYRRTGKMVLRLLILIIALSTSSAEQRRQLSADEEKCNEENPGLRNGFSWIDYLVLAIMLLVSCLIGTFYGFFSKKQKTSKDFLLGGSNIGTIPMAMSLAASFITAIELLGNPAEMYSHGTQFWMTCVAFVLVVPITSKLYLPVFMKLRLTSTYEYLNLRFNRHCRLFASGLYMLQMILYSSVAVYAPALALSHVTGLDTYLAVALVYVVCIFYASQGGMKAVIMTDTFQGIVLLISLFVVVSMGMTLQGGISKVWQDNLETDRIEFFNLDPRPTIRHSFWSVVIGGTFYWVTIINFLTGMILYSANKGCDPLNAGYITGQDQLLPLYVMNFLGDYPGIPGLFVAGIFAASLGTVASALNSLAAITCEDIFQGIMNMQVALSFNGMVGGVTLGMFSLGMFVPWANAKGALTGAITAFLLVLWIGLGAQIATFNGLINVENKEVSVDYCPCINETLYDQNISDDYYENNEVWSLYKISYLWYSMIGCCVTVLIGSLVSFMTEPQDVAALDKNLLSPVTKYFIGNSPSTPIKNISSNNNNIQGITNLALELEDEKFNQAVNKSPK